MVHFVEPGYHIGVEEGRLGIIHTASNRVVKDLGVLPHLSKEARLTFRVKPAAKARGVRGLAPITDGWIVNSEWTNDTGNPISYFKTRWEVPPAPATDDGQLVYLFNGMQQAASGPFILQPVLQWGSSPAGGGRFWSITSWYVNGEGGVALHGSLKRVNPGDVIEGIMTLTAQEGNEFSYLSSFTGFPTADLAVHNVDELQWACETLECYSFKAFSDYPATPLTAFRDIEIRVRQQTTPAIVDVNPVLNWLADNRVTDNGQRCLVANNDNPGGDIDLYYRNPHRTHSSSTTRARSERTRRPRRPRRH